GIPGARAVRARRTPIPPYLRRARSGAWPRATRPPLVPRAPRGSSEARRRWLPRSCDSGRSRTLTDRLRERALEDPPDDATRVEMLLSQRTGQAALSVVIGLDARERKRGFVNSPEAEDTLCVE